MAGEKLDLNFTFADYIVEGGIEYVLVEPKGAQLDEDGIVLAPGKETF